MPFARFLLIFQISTLVNSCSFWTHFPTSYEQLKIFLLNVNTLYNITQGSYFAFEEFLKISNIGQNRDDFGHIFNFLRTTQNLSYQHKHTLQHQTALFFTFEDFLKISNISQNPDHFGHILHLPTNNSKSFLSM
jgi:hypothetical protein